MTGATFTTTATAEARSTLCRRCHTQGPHSSHAECISALLQVIDELRSQVARLGFLAEKRGRRGEKSSAPDHGAGVS